MPQLEYHLTRLERTCIPDHNPAIMVQCCNGYHVETFKLFPNINLEALILER